MISKKIIVKNLIFAVLFYFSFISFYLHSQQSYIVKTLYGIFTIKEPLLLDLIRHPYMDRLKSINQYGFRYYCYSPQSYTRYEHSLGVFALLRRYNTSLEEQAAGLYHDISHTSFSHGVEGLFDHNSIKSSYQDDVHAQFLEHIGMNKVLEPYNLTIEDIDPKSGKFKALEQDLPDICADRLEYNLAGGLLEKIINQEDIELILNNLKYKDQKWYFLDAYVARKFAEIPLQLMFKVWSSPDECLRNRLCTKAIKRALEMSALSLEDIHFSTDDKIMAKLKSLNDQQVTILLNQAFNVFEYFTLSDQSNYDMLIKSKFRGIDPWVKVNDRFLRLTEIDLNFAKKYHSAKKMISDGWYIKLKQEKH